LLFIFDLFVREIPHHFVSVRPFGFIYKAGQNPISRAAASVGENRNNRAARMTY
jgi:hypothetical protein